ncbi:unnamed protein product [Cuscuta europaea]|uniref:Uncharacterized protein n=1 Tax=Cuscuta europaea TaxID=41803 RepID=A0A9P1EFA8_CUSEU|nr:unnamed protein product [Cuscuta europaea]
MEPISSEERMVSEKWRQKLDEVKRAVETHFSGITDHVNFTLQQAYFRCAYECFDRKKRHEEIENCVERCRLPCENAQNVVQNEIVTLQEKLQRAMLVCKDKVEVSKLQMNKSDCIKDLELCVDQSVQDCIKTLPHIVGRLKTRLGMTDPM